MTAEEGLKQDIKTLVSTAILNGYTLKELYRLIDEIVDSFARKQR